LLDKSIGFIGSGNMAMAIIKGMLAKELLPADRIIVSDASPEQVARVSSATGARGAASNAELASAADTLIIATKPQHVPGVMDEIRGQLDPARHLVISICAGVTTARIEAAAAVPGLPVVRVMPNTPALIGCGSAAIAAGSTVSREQLSVASQIFDSVGTSVIVDEVKLDAVTGVSGSGPAYVFRFMEALLAAATAQGLTEEEAAILVPQMVLGATRMAVAGDRSLAELRTAVTTPGGTTAAGLAVLDAGGFMELIESCVAAATARSRELAAG
jgi:pyrroline-5-carboxylate reductase